MNARVSDPTGARDDPAMPMLRLALQPEYMARRFQACLPPGCPPGAGGEPVHVRAIHVRRHRQGRRCLIEYELADSEPGTPRQGLTLLGKVRAKGLDRRSHEVQTAFWRSGFASLSEDRIGVPEPMGVLPDLAMWLQRKVQGVPAVQGLAGSEGIALAARIAAATRKLQRRGVPTRRRHTLSDEVSILRRQLGPLAETYPAWADRIQRVLAASERLAASLLPHRLAPSHRDFYHDNLLVGGDGLYLVDFDLYCEADPRLDIGNFIGHVTEFSLRTHQNPEAMVHLEQALEEEYARLAGAESRAAVRVYATLTLVRHIAISTRIPERRAWTPALLDLCEQRLKIAPR